MTYHRCSFVTSSAHCSNHLHELMSHARSFSLAFLIPNETFWGMFSQDGWHVLFSHLFTIRWVDFVTLDSSFFSNAIGSYAYVLSTSLSCWQPLSARIFSPNKLTTVVNCFSRSSSFSYSFAGSYHTIILSQTQNLGRRVSQTLTFPTSRHPRLRGRGCCIMLRVLTQAYLVPKRLVIPTLLHAGVPVSIAVTGMLDVSVEIWKSFSPLGAWIYLFIHLFPPPRSCAFATLIQLHPLDCEIYRRIEVWAFEFINACTNFEAYLVDRHFLFRLIHHRTTFHLI